MVRAECTRSVSLIKTPRELATWGHKESTIQEGKREPLPETNSISGLSLDFPALKNK